MCIQVVYRVEPVLRSQHQNVLCYLRKLTIVSSKFFIEILGIQSLVQYNIIDIMYMFTECASGRQVVKQPGEEAGAVQYGWT